MPLTHYFPKIFLLVITTSLLSSCSWLRMSPKCSEPCAGYNFIWSGKVDCRFKKKVYSVAKDLWPDNAYEMSNNLMAIMALESGGTFKTGVPNARNSGGTGLIQIMPSTYRHLTGKAPRMEYVDFWGTGKRYKRVSQLARMSEVQYLNLVKKYFRSLKGKDVEFVDLYLKVLLPVSAGKPNHAVFASSYSKLSRHGGFKNESARIKRIRVNNYQSNNGLDINGDGRIMKSEIARKIYKFKRNGRRNMCR